MRQSALTILLLLALMLPGLASAAGIGEKWDNLSKENKALAVNFGLGAFITAWGVANWDYFQQSPQLDSEGWFSRDTPEGGVDKVGHAYSSYAFSHALSSRYRAWGFEHQTAALYGALSAFGVQAYMELGDAFSGNYGFSYEDFISNAAGSVYGYVTWMNPSIQEKLDFRMEYKPAFDTADILTDYNHQKYLLALKLGGFEPFRTGPLRYLELHAGYYTRNYDDRILENDERNFYVGLSINLSSLFRGRGFEKTATFLNYYQPPYTYLEARHNFND